MTNNVINLFTHKAKKASKKSNNYTPSYVTGFKESITELHTEAQIEKDKDLADEELYILNTMTRIEKIRDGLKKM